MLSNWQCALNMIHRMKLDVRVKSRRGLFDMTEFDLRSKHSQFLEFLAKLPGIRSEDAYSVVVDSQDAQHAETVQPPFVDFS